MERIVILSNTVGRQFEESIKTTAVREIGNIQVVSLLTSNECDYIKLVKKIAETSSHLFVDLEKKQPLDIKNIYDQKGNLYNSIYKAINKLNLSNKLNLYPIKMNDITVSATWKLLVSEFNDIAGLTFGLIGTGNIGSKLTSVLTESGVKMRCFNRDINKAIAVVNSVLLTKPAEVIASPQVVRKIEHTIINSSCLIIACSELTENLLDYISLIHGSFNIYLIGHSILHKNTLNKFKKADINVKRIDVGKELLSYIIGTIQTKDFNVFGNKLKDGVNFCSGGYLGDENDLIVDDYNSPKWYYAHCDGSGGILYKDKNIDELNSINQFDGIYK